MKRLRTGLATAALSLGLAGPAFGQFTNWNGSGTDWGTAANWTNGVPLATNTAQFLPSVPSFGFASQQPTITGTQTALGLTIGPSPSYGGWTFTGSGELVLGGIGSTGLTTYGPAAHTFNGPTLAGSASGTLSMSVTSGSTLTLTGSSVVTVNPGTVTVAGGRLRLDNAAVNAASRLSNGGALTVNGGGVFELIGNAAGTTQNVGNISTATLGGVNTFRLTPNGAATVLSFANATNGFTTRPGTRAAYRFEATSGNLGDANGARVTFGAGGVPNLGANGLLAHTSGGQTVGYAVVSDAGGTDFATWNAMDGIVRAGPAGPAANGGLVSDAAGLATQTTTSRTFFSPAAGATVTASGTVTTGSLRISPAGAGAVLAMGANPVQTNAIMLDGPESFTLTGTGTIGASPAGGTRYIHVNDPQATLRISQVVASSTNPVVFAGPGTVELTGTALQNTNTDNSRVAIAGGVLRANNTQLNFVGTNSVLALVGGVLEIKNGNNGTGASSDFRRAIGVNAGQVNWGAGATNEIGSGGFSAFGSNASVNLGGAIDPGTVRWNSSSFVATGYALTFGSPRSNAVLTFRNPIQLDAGTAGGYLLREIRVTAGTGGDRTILDGGLFGSETTDLIKTGNGTLELRATGSSSTILGHTLVADGTLLATNDVSSTGTGNVVVGGMATLGGTGKLTPTGGNAVTVLPGGFLVPGTPGTPDVPGTLNVLGPVSLTSGSTLRLRLNNTTAGSGYGQLAVNGLSLGGAALQLVTGGTFNPAAGDRLVIVPNTGTRDGTTFGGLAQNGTGTTADGGFNYQISYFGTAAGELTGGNSVVLYNFAPVPEPTAVLALAVGGLGLFRLRRRFV